MKLGPDMYRVEWRMPTEPGGFALCGWETFATAVEARDFMVAPRGTAERAEHDEWRVSRCRSEEGDSEAGMVLENATVHVDAVVAWDPSAVALPDGSAATRWRAAEFHHDPRGRTMFLLRRALDGAEGGELIGRGQKEALFRIVELALEGGGPAGRGFCDTDAVES